MIGKRLLPLKSPHFLFETKMPSNYRLSSGIFEWGAQKKFLGGAPSKFSGTNDSGGGEFF